MRTIFLTIFLILGLIPTANAADKWIKAESPNFIAYSNSNEKITRAYVKSLEQYRYVLDIFHNQMGEATAPQPKTAVYLLKTQKKSQGCST